MKIILIASIVLFGIKATAQEGTLILKARKMLAGGATISKILQDPQFDSIRPETDFRQLIRENSTTGPLTIVTENEPGVKIRIRGKIVNAQNVPLSNKLVYIYQTDTRGWYGSDRGHFQMNEGDRRHARIFGYLKTDETGSFEFNTIQPHGYPQSDLPAHIHFEVFNTNNSAEKITELLFEDDERLKGETKTRSENEGFYIAAPTTKGNKKTYSYTIIVGGH